jgi:hypothetical protein
VQHGHLLAALGQLVDELHVVFHHHQRMLAFQRQEQLGRALGLFVGHAGHRFVQQQQLRVLHQQHADLQPLLLAVAQQAGGALGLVLQVDQWQQSRRCGRAAAPVRRENRLARTPAVGGRASSRFSKTLSCS